MDLGKTRQFQKNIYFCLIDYAKALTVWITTNCGKFLEMGVPDNLTCLLRNLYAGQEATVRTRHGTVNWFQIGKVQFSSVAQSCLSLCDPMDCSIPGFPVQHRLPELA